MTEGNGSQGRRPNLGQTVHVSEDGIIHRDRCRVADEPVVAMKFRPAKAREGVEGKTGTIRSKVCGDGRWPKATAGCEGAKFT